MTDHPDDRRREDAAILGRADELELERARQRFYAHAALEDATWPARRAAAFDAAARHPYDRELELEDDLGHDHPLDVLARRGNGAGAAALTYVVVTIAATIVAALVHGSGEFNLNPVGLARVVAVLASWAGAAVVVYTTRRPR